MKAMLMVCAMLLALTALAEDKPMLAKDGTPLPEGVARIVKWQASQLRAKKQTASIARNADVRKTISGIPDDGMLYAIEGRNHGAGYLITATDTKAGGVTVYVFHCDCNRDPSRTYVIIE